MRPQPPLLAGASVRRPSASCPGEWQEALSLPNLRAEHPLVALTPSSDLFICAKNLLVEAMAPTGPGTKTFAIDQSFEPDARTRRPTAVGAALKMFGSNMSDEFDSLDASEKAARNNAKRPSDDVVQTAPVKCRYTKSGICANIAGFCLCRQANFALPSSHDARTGKSGA